MKGPLPLTDPAAEALQARLGQAPWRVIHTEPALPGAEQMALDRALLQAAPEAPGCTLRFYTWAPPAVSLGRFQSSEGIHLEAARERGWDVVRRPTGGRAVLHQFELTYAVVIPARCLEGAGVRTSYTVLIAALHGGLQELLAAAPGLELSSGGGVCAPRTRGETNCFALSSECDSLAGGRKLVGSAQVRQDGALLQHGSILLDASRDAWTALFGNSGHLVTLRELLGATPSLDDVREAVSSGFIRSGIRLEPGVVTGAEWELARRLRDQPDAGV